MITALQPTETRKSAAGTEPAGREHSAPSFSDLVASIEAAKDLPDQKRRHWACSVRQVAKWLDRPCAVIPARWPAVRFSVGQLHHARLGVTSKTLSNHRSNLKAALRWFGKEEGPQRGARLTPEWTRFVATLERSARQRLSSLVRYCSARRVEPALVNDVTFADYWRYRAETTGLATHNTMKRFVVRAWNDCAAKMAEWSLERLAEPPLKAFEPAWEKFPAGLRKDIENYLERLAKPHRSLSGKRIAPCKTITLEVCRAKLVAMARMAVTKLGTPIESLTSLGALLHPDLAEKVIDRYWQNNGEEPKTATINFGKMLLRMARETGCLDQAAIERLDDMRAALEDHRRQGLTPKNDALVRQVLTEGVWKEVLSLPKALMRQAGLARDHAPTKAAVLAQHAVAIAIETFAPVRLRNLMGIELGQNLSKPGGIETPYWLVFPNYDVKNRVDLNFKFDQQLTDLIDEYIHDFRPTLLRGSNSNLLFPGKGRELKNGMQFSKQLTQRIQKAVGLRITVHQFRHAAAAFYLKHKPGDYETVRRLLGHKDIQTTVRFYCGLETIAATEQFGKIIRQKINFDEEGEPQ
jgi:integrase-like protein